MGKPEMPGFSRRPGPRGTPGPRGLPNLPGKPALLGIPKARRPVDEPPPDWRSYQQPLRWDTSAALLILGLLALGALFAFLVLHPR